MNPNRFSKPLRILFVIARGDAFGGSSLHVMDMAERLRQENHIVRILVGGTADMEVPQRFAERGLDFVCIGSMSREIRPVADARATLEIRRCIREFAPDLVSLHASKAGGLGRLAALGLGVPLVYTPHCWAFVDGFPRARFYLWLERFLAPLADRIVTVCEDERRFGLDHGVGHPHQIVAIHNGVRDGFGERGPCREPSGDAVRIVMVGRFEKQKDQRFLISALSRLKAYPWRLTLVGDGPLRKECEELVGRKGLGDRVSFPGYSKNVARHLLRNDLFLLVTNWEGFPRSILEAMSAALPVVVTDVGGSREAVVDPVTGKLVAPGDAEELEKTLREIFENPSELPAMGREGRNRYLELFTFDRMYERYTAFYAELIREREARRKSGLFRLPGLRPKPTGFATARTRTH